jgi:hypothetical protein
VFSRALPDEPVNFSGDFLADSQEIQQTWNEIYSLCLERRSLLLQSSAEVYRERLQFFLIAAGAQARMNEVPKEFSQLCVMTIQDMASEQEQDISAVIKFLHFSRAVLRASVYCAEIAVDCLETFFNYWREFDKGSPADQIALLHFEILYFIQDLIQSLSSKESIQHSLIPAYAAIHDAILSNLNISIVLVSSSIPIHEKLAHSQTLITLSLSILQSVLDSQSAASSIQLVIDLIQHNFSDYQQGLHNEGLCETYAILDFILELSYFSKESVLNLIRSKGDRIKYIFYFAIKQCLASTAIKFEKSFKRRKGKIAKIFMTIFEIYIRTVKGSDQEGHPATLMLTLQDMALISKVPQDSPFLQTYILEFLSKYMQNLSEEQENYCCDSLVYMNLIESVLTPALLDLPDCSFSRRALKYFKNIIHFCIKSPSGCERLIRTISTSLGNHKNLVSYLGKINTVLKWIIDSMQPNIVEIFLKYKIVESIINTILDVECQTSKESEPALKQMLYSLLNIPELAIHLKSFPHIFQQFTLEDLFQDEPNEFAKNLYLFVQKGSSIYILKNLIQEKNERKAASLAELYTSSISNRITPQEIKYILGSLPKFSSNIFHHVLRSLITVINSSYVKIPRQKVLCPRAYFDFEEGNLSMKCTVDNSLLPASRFSIVFWVFVPENYSQTTQCLQCIAEFATQDYEFVFKIMLNKGLQINLVYWGSTQSFSVTTYGKLEAGCWNMVSVCMQAGVLLSGKKFELSIYINSTDDGAPSNYKLDDSSLNISYPKEAFNRLTLGCDHFNQQMRGKMNTFYIFTSYLGPNSIKAIYNIGPNYEMCFNPEADITVDLLKLEQSIIRELSNVRYLIWSPRRRAPLILPYIDMIEFQEHSLRVTSTRIPEAIIAAGGIRRLLPLLKHSKKFGAEAVSEVLKLISAICAHPSPITQKEITQNHFFEVLCLILQDSPINEDCMLAIFDCLQRVDWCKTSQKKAIQELLLDSNFWNQMDVKYHTSLVVFIWNFIPEHYADVKRRIAMLMNIMGTHWVTMEPEKYKDVRKSYLDLLTQAFGDSLTSSDLIDMTLYMLDFEADTYTEEILNYITEIVAQRPRDFKDESKNDIINLLLNVMNEKKNSPYLQSKVIQILRHIAFTGEELKDQRFYAFNQKIAIEMKKVLEVSAKFEHIICSMRKCLPQELDFKVYSALMEIFNETSEVLKNSLVNKIKAIFLLLDIITDRIRTSPQKYIIFEDFLRQAQANPRSYLILNDRDNFPFWLLKTFVGHKDDLVMREMLENFTFELFFYNICSKRSRIGKSWKLRQFVIWLVQYEVDIEFIYSILQGILNRILKSKYSDIVPEFVVNLLDIAYVIEDMIHIKPEMLNYWESYYKLLSTLIDISKKYNVLHCTWPSIPDLSFGALNNCLKERPVKKDQDGVLVREGGMFRIVLKLLLIALDMCGDEYISAVRELMMFVLRGGDTSGKIISIKSSSSKTSLEKKLRELKVSKYSSIFNSFPLKEEEDRFYDTQFVALYILAELTEILISTQSQNKLDQILDFIHRIMIECKLPEKILNISKKVNSVQRNEFHELFRDSYEQFHSTARTHKNLEVVYNSIERKVRRSRADIDMIAGSSLETEDFSKGELKNWQNEVKRLTSDLNKGKIDKATLKDIITGEPWITNIQIYLIAAFSMKLNLIYKPSTFYEISYDKEDTTSEVSFFDRALNFTRQKMEELKTWKKNKARDLERKQILVKSKMKIIEKQMVNITEEAEETFWKISQTVDGYLRRNILVRNKKGSRLLSKVNKKYAKEAKEAAEAKNIRSLSMLVWEEDPEAIIRMGKFEYGDESMKLPDMLEENEDTQSQISMDNESEYTERDSIPLELDKSEPDSSFRCECERIQVKGSVYGDIEITPEYFIFRSYNRLKPDADEYFGSALKISGIVIEYEKAWEKHDIVEIIIRRFIHRYTAIEIFLYSGRSYYFNFFSPEDREQAFEYLKKYGYRKLLADKNLSKELQVTGLTRLWKQGEISNFEYLMQLNKFGSRSYHEIGQYPVFPWILSDYKSSELDLNNPDVYRDLTRPIGSVLEAPRKEAERRYQQLNSHEMMMSFHYGSHYSNGGIVSHFLIRLEPFATYAVILQGGFFDVADRLFASIQQSYNGSTIHAGDYKELVPEFFYLPDFLLNKNGYYFGKKQTGGPPVSDVDLPEWAGPPGIFGALNFIRLHRKALESRFVSEKLPRWIDLIFGYKQKGPNAIGALNTYCHITYEDCISKIIGENADPELAQDGIIQQIVYYGQTPVQLFATMHVNRDAKPYSMTFFDKAVLPNSYTETQDLKILKQENETIIAIFVTKRKLICVKDSWKLIIYPCTTGPDKIVELGSVQEYDLSGVYLNICDREQWTDYPAWNSFIPNELTAADIFTLSHIHFSLVRESLLVSGMHMDLSFKCHNLKGKLIRSIYHHCGVVTCVTSAKELLLTGSLDTSIAVWKVSSDIPSKIPITVLSGHLGGILQVCASSSLKVSVSLDLHNQILVHDIRSGVALRDIKLPSECKQIFRLALSEVGIIAAATLRNQSIHFFYINGDFLTTECTEQEDMDCILFNSFGDSLVAGGNESVTLFNIFESNLEVKTIPYTVVTTVRAIGIVPGDTQILYSLNQSSVFSMHIVTEQARTRAFDLTKL